MLTMIVMNQFRNDNEWSKERSGLAASIRSLSLQASQRNATDKIFLGKEKRYNDR